MIIPINQTYKSSKSMRSSAALIEDIAHSDVNRIIASKKRRGRPPSQAKQEKSIKVCATCFTKLYQGCRHTCSTARYRQKKIENIEELISSPKSAKSIAKRTLKRYRDDDVVNYMKKELDSDKTLFPRKKLFSADDMCLIRKDLNLSSRQTLVLAQDLRNAVNAAGPRSVFESSTKMKMYEKNHELDEFFELKTLSFSRNSIGDKKEGLSILIITLSIQMRLLTS